MQFSGWNNYVIDSKALKLARDARRKDLIASGHSPAEATKMAREKGCDVSRLIEDTLRDKFASHPPTAPQPFVRLTTVGGWREGARVNLERALKLGDELGGHIVTGHVDGLGEVIALRHMFWSFSNAMAYNPQPWAGGALAYCNTSSMRTASTSADNPRACKGRARLASPPTRAACPVFSRSSATSTTTLACSPPCFNALSIRLRSTCSFSRCFSSSLTLPPLALTISATRWSMSVPVMISPLITTVALRWLGSFLAKNSGLVGRFSPPAELPGPASCATA